MSRSRRLCVLAGVSVAVGMGAACVLPAAAAANVNPKASCWYSQALCTELANPGDLSGHWYVGHDEPSLLFYSQVPGSGNNVQYQLQIPSEPGRTIQPVELLQLRATPHVLVRDGPVRDSVLSRAAVHLHAG
jgi:hypothetical protein